MKKSKIDIPVALIFFNRPESLRVTFEAIRQSRPSKLFLIQDGAREGNEKDLLKIQECRKIVNEVDWECSVTRNYSDVNLGCGMRIYSGLKKAFEKVDRLCILEDDCTPSNDYFLFCKELLERYKDDLRVGMICGMNNFGKYEDTPYSYMFAIMGSVWGWATWRRVWERLDYNIDIRQNKYVLDNFGISYPYPRMLRNLLEKNNQNVSFLREEKKLSSWSFQHGLGMVLNSQLTIVPKFNMITNNGCGPDATNGANDIDALPKAVRILYELPMHKMPFPLEHPDYIMRDVAYEKKLVHQLNKESRLCLRISRGLEVRFLKLKKYLNSLLRK